jgi:RND family efflux transporter MFP subunit
MNMRSPRTLTPHAVLGVCGFALLFFLGCGGKEQVEQEPVVRPIKMMTIGGGGGGGTLEYPGEVQAAQNAEISFEVPGKIVELPVDEGQSVRKGALLARLDNADFVAARDRERARMQAAKAEYERHQELYETNAVSLADLEAKRRNFEVTEAQLRTAQKALDDTRLLAPFGGQVARKIVDEFQNVQAKQPILLLQDESSLEVVISVPERDWAQAKPGLTLEERTERAEPKVEISSIPGRQFNAHIKEFATIADPTTRTYRATFGFDAPSDVTIRAGMTAKVILTISGDVEAVAGTIMIPSNAVESDENGNPYVWKIDPDAMTVSRNSVVLGELSGSQITVQSGLTDGDRIAISGVNALREGMQVSELNN